MRSASPLTQTGKQTALMAKGQVMVLYGTIRETPNDALPYVAVITDQDGKVVATQAAATRQQADDSIQEIKFKLNKLVIEKRVRRKIMN